MRFINVLPLAVALGSAFVLPPDQQIFENLAIEDHHEATIDHWLEKAASTKDEAVSSFRNHFESAAAKSKDAWDKITQCSQSVLDQAFERAKNGAEALGDGLEQGASDLSAWLEGNDHGHHGPHRPGRRPHKPPHHHKPNETVYQLIAGSKYTTKLAKLINDYPDLVDALNGTKANYTIFAPTDKAFEKIPEHAPKPGKALLKAILTYHVVPDFYPAARVLSTHTVPTLLKGDHLSSEPQPQRLAFKLGLRGLTVNFFHRVVAVNIFGTNGVIHGIDSIILPPPNAITLIDLFPGEFSTLELGLGKTGLLEKLNTTEHAGGTLFAPSNFAFQKLGPKVNAFLFSQYGRKYLKALLEYHVVPGNTLYSDAIYQAKSSEIDAMKDLPKKGHFHIDLPTLLKDRTLSVDVARFGGFISIRINAFSSVSVQDGIAEDGVIHVVRDVLIPPRKIGGGELEQWDGSELTVEDLQERLEPFVGKADL